MTRTLTLFAFAALAVSAQEGQFDRTLKVNGPVDLTLSTDSGGIVVVAGPAGTVTVHAKLKAQNNWFSGGDLGGQNPAPGAASAYRSSREFHSHRHRQRSRIAQRGLDASRDHRACRYETAGAR